MFIKVSNFDVGIRHRLPSVFPTSLHKQLVIYVLRHGGCHALQSKISPSLIGERTHITLAVRRQGYHTLVCILDTDIRNFECGKWFKTPDGFRNITLRLVAHFLPDDLSFVGHTEQHRATFAVKESAERFHAALQLPGGFLELHLPFPFRLSVVLLYRGCLCSYSIRNNCTKIAFFAEIRGNSAPKTPFFV